MDFRKIGQYHISNFGQFSLFIHSLLKKTQLVSDMPAIKVGKKKSHKKKKIPPNVKPDDVWYGGAHKYRKGAGQKLMNDAIKRFDTWMITQPQANASEKNKFLDNLCKVNLHSKKQMIKKS